MIGRLAAAAGPATLRTVVLGAVTASLVSGLPRPAGAEGLSPVDADGRVAIVLEDHRFTPAEIHVAAGKPSQLLIQNRDPTADEFDSTALKVEKVIGGGTTGVVRLRSLDPGRYPFMGEFHSDTAQGVVVAE